MNKCKEKDCNEEIMDEYSFCSNHRQHHIDERKKVKEILIENRMKDPFYIEDSLLFLKCAKILIPYQFDQDSDDESEDDSKFWNDLHMHKLLFNEYYDQALSRTHLLIQKVKELHKNCCALEDGIGGIGYEIHEYKMYSNFLTKWIEESEIIEKNKLIKNLDIIDDVKNIVQRIITNL